MIQPHPLTNFEPRFTGVYSRYNLPKTVNNGAYVVNLDDYANIDTHWVVLYVSNNDVTYFDSFGVEHAPEEVERFVGNKSIKANIYRMQAYASIICGYNCIKFVDFTLAGKTLTDYTSLFSPYDFEKNDDIILSYFK